MGAFAMSVSALEALLVSLINVWTNVYLSASLFTFIWEVLLGKIPSPVQWQSSNSSMLLL